MVRTRARAFAAAVAIGTAVPLLAQPPADEPSFVVLPPCALKLPEVPLNPNAAEIPVGFFTPAPQQPPQAMSHYRPPAPNYPQTVQTRPWWLTAPQSQNAINAAQSRPNPTGFQMQPLTGGVPKPQAQSQLRGYPALTAPTTAPAWRWHGYGSVTSGDPQPTTPGAIAPANANLSVPIIVSMPPHVVPGPAMPHAATPLPMPTGLPIPVNDGTGPLPGYSPPPAAPEASPFPPSVTGGAAWKPSERISVLPSNPIVADSRVVQAGAQVPASASIAAWTPAVAAAKRQVDDSSVRSAFIPAPPPPPAATPESLTRLHSAIEMLLLGRGHNLEVYQRNSTSLLVRFKVKQAADAEALANGISKLPGLAVFQVVYEISVAQ